ncbi:MAG: septum formation inhibitor Maf [Acidobacteria bacterium]|jgi:septum formation protein|nr:MAG: septum formation inhibitor Maf [Acidobacteriota bacterium]
MRVVLASESPRRAELMRAAGFEIEVVPSGVEERRRAGEEPEAYVRRLAVAKALTATACDGDTPIVAADTVVLADGRLLEKPADDHEAADMLRLLSGRTHEVLTGVAVRFRDQQREHVERTRVRMARLGEAEIAWYVATGEPLDKAGAYAAQGLASRFIEAIDGSYSNVVGLPVAAVYQLLRELLGSDTLSVSD